MCREVFKKFRACINVKNVNAHRADRDAIDVVCKNLQQDREQADVRDIIRKLHEVVDKAIEVQPEHAADDPMPPPYDISRIDFERLKREFERSSAKHTTVQALKDCVEKKLQRLLAQNPLRADFQKHYEEIVIKYNREKERLTIEQTFEALLKLVQELDNEERRAVRENLDEESLAIFDLLKKPDLNAAEIKQIKDVAVELLRTLKTEKLRVDQWREKETTRDAVVVAIRDFLYNEATGLPTGVYSDDEVATKSDDVFSCLPDCAVSILSKRGYSLTGLFKGGRYPLPCRMSNGEKSSVRMRPGFQSGALAEFRKGRTSGGILP